MDVAIATVCLVLLMTAGAAIRRHARAVRRRRREQRWPNASWATESSALRMLLSGTLNKKEYRKIVEAIAAYDAVTRPVRLPAPGSSDDAARQTP